MRIYGNPLKEEDFDNMKNSLYGNSTEQKITRHSFNSAPDISQKITIYYNNKLKFKFAFENFLYYYLLLLLLLLLLLEEGR